MIGKAGILKYSALNVGLFMTAMPVYLLLPAYYSSKFSLSLASLGLALLIARLVDAFVDPLIGGAFRNYSTRLKALKVAMPLLLASFMALMNPLYEPGEWFWTLFTLLLLLYYVSLSVVNIIYQAYGAEISQDINERTRITSVREALGMLGTMVAVSLPAILGYPVFSVIAACVYVALCFVSYRFLSTAGGEAGVIDAPPRSSIIGDIISEVKLAVTNRQFIILLVIFTLTALSSATTATLFSFYTAAVLQAGDQSGYMLVVYFISAVVGMPLWYKLSTRIGKMQSWLVGTSMAVASFIWAYNLSAGDITSFYIICVLSGIAAGADLAIPASILADRLRPGESSSSYFGLWNFSSKLMLAIAAGVTLPVLEWMGFVYSAENSSGVSSLSFMYAVLPCFLRLLAIVLIILNLTKWSNSSE